MRLCQRSFFPMCTHLRQQRGREYRATLKGGESRALVICIPYRRPLRLPTWSTVRRPFTEKFSP